MSADDVSTLALQLESNRFNAGLQHSRALMRGLGEESNALTATLKGTAVAMGSLVVGNKMVRMFTSSIQAASAYREDLAQFEHVMRNVTKASDDMVKSLTSDAYGRTSAQARQMLMGMTSLTKGMGMTDKAAVSLSGEFSKMAIDIGSFMMRDPDSVMGAFQSALMGNTMALRSYGVFLNETTLKDAIAANAKKGLVFACERQARAHAVLTEAQKQQADAIGDYAVEAENFGNQLRKFYGNLGELPALFGKGLLEPANEFLKVANSMIDRLHAMDESTWKTVASVTALGTAAGIAFGAYGIGTTALTFYRAAQVTATGATAAQTLAAGNATAATAGATAAITAETAALGANTAARVANTAATTAGAGARAAGGTGTTTMVATPYMDNLRVTHSRASREAVTNSARYDSLMQKYNQTSDSRYLAGAQESFRRERVAIRQRNTAEMGMEAFYGRGISATHGVSPATATYMRQNRLATRRRQLEHQRTLRNLYNAPTRGVRSVGRGMRSVGRGIGRSAVGRGLRSLGRGTSAVAGATVGRLPGAGLITGFVRQIGGVVLRLAPTFFTRLGTMALAAINPVGWGVAILTGLAAVGNYLPTLMYKAYDGLMSVFSAENFGKMWEWCKTSAMSMFTGLREWLGKGLYGIGQIAESVFYTAINALGNGLRSIIQRVTLGAVDIGEFEYKSSGYAAYEQHKKVNELQAKLDEQREAQAKREKQITEFRSKVSEQERQWLDREEALLKKRSELAAARFDSTAKLQMLEMKVPQSNILMRSIDNAMQSVGGQLKRAEQEYIYALQSGKSDDIKEKAEDRYNVLQARYDELSKQREQHAVSAIEQRYALFDSRFEHIGQMKTSQERKGGYTSLLSQLQNEFSARDEARIESEYRRAQNMLNVKRREYNDFLAFGYTEQAGRTREEIEQAEKRLENAKAAFSELQTNFSQQRKVQDSIDALAQEQERRYKDAQQSLWSFNFDHAKPAAQQQMARSAFFEAQNRFEGARSDDEREKALQDMQSMYGKMDMDKFAEMPVWNGIIRTTAGAVESDSIAAQELQERVMNDFNKTMLDNAQKQTVIQEQMREALQVMVQYTNPNNQMRPVGGSVWDS